MCQTEFFNQTKHFKFDGALSLACPCLFNSAMQLSYDLQAFLIEMLIIIVCVFVALNFASCVRC